MESIRHSPRSSRCRTSGRGGNRGRIIVSMSLPSLEHEPDLLLVNAVTTASSAWPHGTITVRSIARIGVDFGLSGGQVYRVEASTEDGGSISFVLKREGVQAVERAARFHRLVRKGAAGSIPAYFGSCLDHMTRVCSCWKT